MNSHRIMIVDDDPHVLSSLERLLLRDNYQVFKADNAYEALTQLEKEPVDLIISDLRMPDMSGLELLTQVKARFPDIIRIILTGYAEIESIISAINQGEVYRFLTKPWNDFEIRFAIKQALERRDLELENKKLTHTVCKQSETLKALEKKFPGIACVEKTEDGAIIIDKDA